MAEIGYTKKQAERLKHKIDLDVATVEDTLGDLAHRVSDTSASGYTFGIELESIRDFAEDLKRTVDRRTRRQ